MLRFVSRCVAAIALLSPATAYAGAITLNLAYFSSDRSILYQAGIKPFVEAVNAAGQGLLQIDVHFSGALGSVVDEPGLLRNGKADVAFMIPGYTPEIFYDDGVLDLPGLFRSGREATNIYTRLAARGAFRSYEELVVLGAFASEPQSIHSRKRIRTIADVRGLRVRTNNVTEAAALEALGAIPVPLPINKTADALSSGAIDAAMAPPAMLFEFGIGRVTTHHYMIRGSSALMLLAISRKRFDSLPQRAQEILIRHSLEWAATQYNNIIDNLNNAVLEQLNSDPRRNLVFPYPAERAVAQQAFDKVSEEWAGRSKENSDRLALVKSEVQNYRSEETADDDDAATR